MRGASRLPPAKLAITSATAANLDPTRTISLRNALVAFAGKRYNLLAAEIKQLVVSADAFGLKPAPNPFTTNAWQFSSLADKVSGFLDWVKTKIKTLVSGPTEKASWLDYVKQAYLKGVGKAFGDVRAADKAQGKEIDQAKDEFLKQSFGLKTPVEKVNFLVTRTFTHLDGINEQMSTDLARVLADGLTAGSSPDEIARQMVKQIGLTKTRAVVIARTEIIRAHAEGQLDAFDRMGIETVGVAVEWTTAHDGRVCPLCAPLGGVVLTVAEARGKIPRHPRCRCAWVPNLGQTGKGTKDTKGKIVSAFIKSDKAGGDEFFVNTPVAVARPDGPLVNQAHEQCTCPVEGIDLMLRDFMPTQDNANGDRKFVTGLNTFAPEQPSNVPINNLLSAALGTIDAFIINNNPKGCNQFSGPGCTFAHHDPKTYGELKPGDKYTGASGKVKEVASVSHTQAGFVHITFKGESGTATIHAGLPLPNPVHGSPSHAPTAHPPSGPPAVSHPPVSPPPTPTPPVHSPPVTSPSHSGGTHDLSSASGLVAHLKASGAAFTELDLHKIALLNPNGIQDGKFKAPTIPVGKENAKQLEKLGKVLPAGTKITGKYVTKKDITPEAIAAVAGHSAVVTSVKKAAPPLPPTATEHNSPVGQTAATMPKPNLHDLPFPPGSTATTQSAPKNEHGHHVLGDAAKLAHVTPEAKKAIHAIEADFHSMPVGNSKTDDIAKHLTNLSPDQIKSVAAYFGANLNLANDLSHVTGRLQAASRINIKANGNSNHAKTHDNQVIHGSKSPSELPTIHNSPTAHVLDPNAGQYDTKSTLAFEAQNPHIKAVHAKDDAVTGEPNSKLPDHTRPPVADERTASHINNYTWGYDGPMNESLRNTDKPPKGKFGGAGSKPNKNGPDMYNDLQKQFAAAKPFGPPPIQVKRGISVDEATLKRLQSAAQASIDGKTAATMPGFTSTSTDKAFNGNVQFVIQAIHGLDVRPYSHFPTETELLINHNAQYQVTKVEKVGDKLHIHMNQLTGGLSPKTGIELK